MMVGNYFKVAVRNIQKRKLYSFINAFGLSIGIAFCMLIWLFIQDELSFDQFHENKNDIYRIEHISFNAWTPNLTEKERWSREAWLQLGVGPAIKEECPEVVHFTRFGRGGVIGTYKDKVFPEQVTYIDKGFFQMFSFPLLKGSREKLFSDKHEIVITDEVAEKYFGDEDPIGKAFELNFGARKELFNVTGVIKAPPANSSISFTMLLPQELRGGYERQMISWGNFNTPLFVQLRSDADTTVFRKNLAALCKKYFGPTGDRWRAEATEPIPAGVELLEYVFTQLPEIHLKSEVSWDKVSDKGYSYILGGIALLILLIACINYVALALTTSAARRTEVGIRKVVGALRKQLFYQFGFESIILAMLSMIIGFGIVILFITAFN
jgi:putative ABC transport system permease protein